MAARKYYVYILRDPRDGKPFYVGKGRSKRMGQHVLDLDKGESRKAEKIREILTAGRGIEYTVDSEWLNENDAYWREAELIRSTQHLTNVILNTGKPRMFNLISLVCEAVCYKRSNPLRSALALGRIARLFYKRLTTEHDVIKPVIQSLISDGYWKEALNGR